MVYYLSPERSTVLDIADLIATTPYDVLYLNSFFDLSFSIKPLLARRLGWVPNKSVIIAPRGEFSSGAIRIKYFKKIVYIQAAGLLHLFDNVTWQASSEHEAQDIIRVLKVSAATIHVALDLPSSLDFNVPISDVFSSQINANFGIRIVFLSRISPKKNLYFALKVLCYVKVYVTFDIYGPAEDTDYWKSCEKLIDQLPTNVSVNYFGSVRPEQVPTIFSRYDLFFFPTQGENYGHVIAEALSMGTPVLLSDQTPWRDLQADRLGWDLALDDMDAFVSIIETYSSMPPNAKREWRRHILNKIVRRLNDPQVFEANRELFRRTQKTLIGMEV